MLARETAAQDEQPVNWLRWGITLTFFALTVVVTRRLS